MYVQQPYSLLSLYIASIVTHRAAESLVTFTSHTSKTSTPDFTAPPTDMNNTKSSTGDGSVPAVVFAGVGGVLVAIILLLLLLIVFLVKRNRQQKDDR